MQIFNNPNYNFIRWRWHAIGLSLAVIIAGAAVIATRGLPLGIDFSGGTLLIVQFEKTVSEDQVRDAVDGIPGDKVVQQYGAPEDRQFVIRLPQTATVEQGTSLEQGSRQIEEALQKANLGTPKLLTRDIVGPVIGADLQRKGIYATLASILAITVYIAVRFRPSFAIGAIAATFHDLLVTFAFLAFFGYDLSLNVVAALLTITGYSVNDTIVIFDRIREDLKLGVRGSFRDVMNQALNQTLSRTIITSGTVFLATLSLYLFGGGVINDFAFTFLVGILTGTYSSIYIASALVLWWHKGQRPALGSGVAMESASGARQPAGTRA